MRVESGAGEEVGSKGQPASLLIEWTSVALMRTCVDVDSRLVYIDGQEMFLDPSTIYDNQRYLFSLRSLVSTISIPSYIQRTMDPPPQRKSSPLPNLHAQNPERRDAHVEESRIIAPPRPKMMA